MDVQHIAQPSFVCPEHGNIGMNIFAIVVQTSKGPIVQRRYCMPCTLKFFDTNIPQVRPLMVPSNGDENAES